MENAVEGAGEGSGSGESQDNAVQDSGADGANIRQQELGDHGGNDEGVGGILPSHCEESHIREEGWNTPMSDKAIQEAGLWLIQGYVRRR